MPSTISAPHRRISVSDLNPSSFAPFGEVIQNPSTHNGSPALERAHANQGTATKWLDVSHMAFHRETSKDEKEGKCVMNMFVCRPRELKRGRLFDVRILERHPCTAQTFVPMGLGRAERETAYLVVVAPTLPIDAWDKIPHQPVNPQDDALRNRRAELMQMEKENMRHSRPVPKGFGPPDLASLRAFIARGDQAVTYGPGTWHAPMVVLGQREVEFVVVQYANGVADDDCQEIEIAVEGSGDGVQVDIGSGIELKVETAKL